LQKHIVHILEILLLGEVVKKDSKSSKKLDLLNCLMENPTQSISKIAEKTNMYRRTVWQKKKELEEDHTIWGYTTIIDESKLNFVSFIALFKIKPLLSKKFPDLIINRLTTDAPSKIGVRLIDVLFTTGEYACVIRFSAQDHITAKRYYETLRAIYNDYFLGDPLLFEVDFPLVMGGKLNPEIEKLYDFLPKIPKI